jgi:hypothetical protein
MKIWNYYIPSKDCNGWGKFIIDSTGYFSCVSDYGNYAFQWTAHGEDDFREFLVSLDNDYLMGKLAGGRTEFDAGLTRQLIREHIFERRKTYDINKLAARNLWDRVSKLEDKESFKEFFEDDAPNEGVEFSDWWEMFHYGHPHDLQLFCKHLWPRFKEALKEELKVTPRVCKEKIKC